MTKTAKQRIKTIIILKILNERWKRRIKKLIILPSREQSPYIGFPKLAIRIFKTKGEEISLRKECKNLKNFINPLEYHQRGK